jgi:hypothetical protein
LASWRQGLADGNCICRPLIDGSAEYDRAGHELGEIIVMMMIVILILMVGIVIVTIIGLQLD